MASEKLADFFNFLSIEKGLSKNTTEAYRRDLDRFFHYLSINQLSVEQVTAEDLSMYVAWLRGMNNSEFKIGESTISRNIISVRSYFSCTDLVSVRDRAVVELLYSTGARVSEIINLNLNDIETITSAEDLITTVKLKGKGGKERVVPIGSFAVTAVNDYLARARPKLSKVSTQKALFLNQRGGRLTRQSAWNIVAKAAQRAGLKDQVTPHSLRHSFATHLLDGGADIRVVQELLGHSSVTTTQIYTLITIDRLRESYSSAHPRSK